MLGGVEKLIVGSERHPSRGPPSERCDPECDPELHWPVGSGFFAAPLVNKSAVVRKIVTTLQRELATYIRAARAAHDEATHEQNKPENKYDTRGLEASYLARGQSRQVAELELAITQIEALSTAPWPAGTAIGPGALVEVVEGKEHSWHYVAPRAGGTEVTHQQHEILVLTPQSPLGQQLVGRRQGDEIVLDLGRAASRRLRVVSVG